MTASLPNGVVAFFMSDVEGSSAGWATDGGAMREAMAELDVAATECVSAAHGQLLRMRGEGDSHFAVFDRSSDAISAALALQRRLGESGGHGSGIELRVRIAVHVGEAGHHFLLRYRHAGHRLRRVVMTGDHEVEDFPARERVVHQVALGPGP